MAEDEEDWNGLEMIWKVQPIFSKYTNDDVAPLKVIVAGAYQGQLFSGPTLVGVLAPSLVPVPAN